MKKVVFWIIAICLIVFVTYPFVSDLVKPKTTTDVQASEEPLLILDSPKPNEEIASPLVLKGKARGYWFFEASFPAELTNWDGLIIAQGIGQAQSDWMTEEYVPFEVTLEFESPYKEGDPDFMKRGTLILHKDNPSGLPEYDDAHEITVWFETK